MYVAGVNKDIPGLPPRSASPSQSFLDTLELGVNVSIALAIDPMKVVVPAAAAPTDCARVVRAGSDVENGGDVVDITLSETLVGWRSEWLERDENRAFLHVEELGAERGVY